MRAHPFATLVSVADGAPFATHVPLLLDAERGPLGTLVGHVAAPNPHSAAFDERAQALAIFHGPHAYVSPRWYASGPNVPTWNYVAVHAIGRPRGIDDPARVRALLARTAAVFEAGAKEPWTPRRRAREVRRGAARERSWPSRSRSSELRRQAQALAEQDPGRSRGRRRRAARRRRPDSLAVAEQMEALP